MLSSWSRDSSLRLIMEWKKEGRSSSTWPGSAASSRSNTRNQNVGRICSDYISIFPSNHIGPRSSAVRHYHMVQGFPSPVNMGVFPLKAGGSTAQISTIWAFISRGSHPTKPHKVNPIPYSIMEFRQVGSTWRSFLTMNFFSQPCLTRILGEDEEPL